MKLNNAKKLLRILGEEETKKYLNVEEEKIELLINILQQTYIKAILNNSMLNKFCNRIIYEDYGTVFAYVLTEIGKIPFAKETSKKYKSLLTQYMNSGYNTEKKYCSLFEQINTLQQEFKCNLNFQKITPMLEEELERARNKISVKKFLDNGGSLKHVITLLDAYQIEELTENTTLPNTNLQEIPKSLEEYSIYRVKRTEIEFLISKISELNLDEETEKELIKTYYQEMAEQAKLGEFQGEWTAVENKPNLLALLRREGFSAVSMEEKEMQKTKRYQ